MQIGEKIRSLRTTRGMTLEDLADRTDLTKGFLSQLERDLTSPSIATLMDILEALGTDLPTFFSKEPNEKVVFGSEDIFDKTDEASGSLVRWLIPNAQKNQMEPILMTLEPGGFSYADKAHEGEEFGYCLSGRLTLIYGEKRYAVHKGESFYIDCSKPHQLINLGKVPATFLWIATPPSF